MSVGRHVNRIIDETSKRLFKYALQILDKHFGVLIRKHSRSRLFMDYVTEGMKVWISKNRRDEDVILHTCALFYKAALDVLHRFFGKLVKKDSRKKMFIKYVESYLLAQ